MNDISWMIVDMFHYQNRLRFGFALDVGCEAEIGLFSL